MTVFTTVALAALLLEDDHFLALDEVFENLTYYFGTIDGGSTHLHSTIGFSEEHAVKFHSAAFLSSFAEIVNIQELVGLSLELLSLNFYDCIHCYVAIT